MKTYNARQRILQVLCQVWPLSVPLYQLTSPRIGGVCAYRRIKELIDDHGIEIDFYRRSVKGKITNTTCYFLLPDPADVDIDNQRMKRR